MIRNYLLLSTKQDCSEIWTHPPYIFVLFDVFFRVIVVKLIEEFLKINSNTIVLNIMGLELSWGIQRCCMFFRGNRTGFCQNYV